MNCELSGGICMLALALGMVWLSCQLPRLLTTPIVPFLILEKKQNTFFLEKKIRKKYHY